MGVRAHFELTGAPRDLPPEVETACFRVAQEAMTNVLRHSRASNLWVRLAATTACLELTVRDDGTGFDVEAARGRAAAGASLGLVGMEERIAQAGGSLEVQSRPGQGTLLLATFVLAKNP
jgi:signal transduction histidine kinase